MKEGHVFENTFSREYKWKETFAAAAGHWFEKGSDKRRY